MDRVIQENRKIHWDYDIEETYQAGLVLTGTEIKSIRDGRVNIEHAYGKFQNGELWILNMDIATYPFASKIFNHEPKRPRKLLLKKNEIKRIIGKISRKGYTLVPVKLYLKRGWAKIEMAIAKGKKLYDKREKLKKKAIEKEQKREDKKWS